MEFLPFEVELYKQLADLVSEFDAEVCAEIETTEKAYAALPEQTPETEAAALVNAVMNAVSEDDLPSEEKITEFAMWSDQDEKQLQELRIQEAQNPLNQANIRVRCIAALSKISVDVLTLETALSDARAKEIKQKYLSLQTAKAANDLAAQNSFADLPLGSVGSEVWQKLFRYAQQYAGQAYPEYEFPYTGENAKCVLCQQSLDEEAKQRFVRFDSFITGKAAEEFQGKSEDYTVSVKILTNLKILSDDDAQTKLAEFANLSLERVKLVEILSQFLNTLIARRDAFILATTTGNFDDIGAAQALSTMLSKELKALEDEEKQFRLDAKDDEKQKEKALKLAELDGRKNIAENVANLLHNRTSREKRLRLSSCKNSLSTRAISLIVSRLRERHLTSELNAKIQGEICKLGLSYLSVSLKDETKKGESNFQSDLGFKQPIKDNSTVLSEGEQRGLALACYLAEADLRPTKHGLIVDDPVSSLDHQRIEKVARRLVEEAELGRQVIIFTHNVLFYQEVVAQAGEMQIALAQNTIHRNPDSGAGIIETNAIPYQARKVKERIGDLRNELAAIKKAKLSLKSDEYRKAIEGFCMELRKTWERLVEEILLNQSVTRFSYGVETQRFKGVVVEDGDYSQVYFAMKKLSSYTAHDEAAGKQGALPTIEQLGEALEEIDAYHKTIKKRVDVTAKARKALVEPPKAEFA